MNPPPVFSLPILFYSSIKLDVKHVLLFLYIGQNLFFLIASMNKQLFLFFYPYYGIKDTQSVKKKYIYSKIYI